MSFPWANTQTITNGEGLLPFSSKKVHRPQADDARQATLIAGCCIRWICCFDLFLLMKSMRHGIFIAILVTSETIAFSQTSNDSLQWTTDVNRAHAMSKVTGKPIFAFFTGSDWCVWCRKLQSDVFSKPAFKEWASTEVVLLELDFPARKILPAPIMQQNETLKSFFKISGFPTVWLFCISEDKEKENRFVVLPYGSLGYPRDPVHGKEEIKFLEDAKTILASRTCQ